MNLRKDWETIEGFSYEEVLKKVINIFSKWERDNLKITRGDREKTIKDTYGLPYTSSGSFAGLGCHCNVRSVLKDDESLVIYEIALSEENEVVAYLTDDVENEKYIVIGRL